MSRRISSARIVEELEKRAADAPKDSELAISLGEAYLRVDRVEDAAVAYARSAELDPRTELKSLYWEWLGLAREHRGQLEAALEAYVRWMESEPTSIEPLDRVGTLLVSLQRWTDVVLLRPHYVKRAESGTDPRAQESLALYGFVLDQLGSPEDVSPLDRTYAALEADSDSVSMRYLLGVLFYQSRHLEAARAEFERVLRMDRHRTWAEKRFSLMWDSNAARLMLARIARLQGNIEEALDHLAEVEVVEDSAESLREVTSLLLDAGRYQEVLDLLPEEHGEPRWIDRYRAEGLLGQGRIREACELLQRACLDPERPPEEPEAEALSPRQQRSLEKAELLLAQGQPLEALRIYQAMSRARQPLLQVLWGKARTLVALEEWDQARETLEQLLREDPDSSRAWALLAEVSTRLSSTVMHRLARIQLEKLRGAQQPATRVGYLWPAPAGSSLVGFCFQASSLPGKGNLLVTGSAGERARELARLAITLLQTRFESLSLEDPSYRDLHLHAIELHSGEPEEETATLPGQCAAPVLAALGDALCLQPAPSGVVVSGYLELNGAVTGPVEVEESLVRLHTAGYRWNRLVLPRRSAPDLLRIPPSLWLTGDLHLCDTAEELLKACLQRGVD